MNRDELIKDLQEYALKMRETASKLLPGHVVDVAVFGTGHTVVEAYKVPEEEGPVVWDFRFDNNPGDEKWKDMTDMLNGNEAKID